MKRFTVFFLIVTAFLFSNYAYAEPSVTSTDQLSEATFAVLTGTTCGPDVEVHFPDAEIEYYNTIADLLAVLRTGKDGCGFL